MDNNLNVLDILTLDDNKKYVISAIANYNDITYLLIVDINDNENIKIVEKRIYENEIRLGLVDDPELFKNLMPIFYKNGMEALKSLNLGNFEEN